MTDAHLHLKGVEGESGAAKGMCLCAAEQGEWSEVESMALKDRRIVPAFGVHPSFSLKISADWKDLLEERLLRIPAAVIGEIGLDGCDACPVDHQIQLSVFREQLDIASRHGRAVVVHGAKAWGAVADVLVDFSRRIPVLILHGFGASLPLMRRFLQMGAYFSFGPMLCNDNARKVRECFAAVPDGRWLLETDAPNRQKISLTELYEKASVIRDVSMVDETFFRAINTLDFCAENVNNVG